MEISSFAARILIKKKFWEDFQRQASMTPGLPGKLRRLDNRISKENMKESANPVMFGNSIPISSLAISTFRVLDVGGNDGFRAQHEFYPEATHVKILDIKNGWNVEELGLPEGPWEVILANHFIEHILNPDFFLEECRRVMSPDTLLNIGTPNLAAWFNRILFLAGYVPHSIELSTKFNPGKPFNWTAEPLGGHIRVFTVPALCQLLKWHGFKILSVEGEKSTYLTHPFISWIDRTATRFSPTLASAFRVKCTL